jgi:putative ABC transport system substrate-binding protein
MRHRRGPASREGAHPPLLLFGVEYRSKGSAMATPGHGRIESRLAAILAAAMGRREFIALLGCAAAAWPLGARAQRAGRITPRVGVLWHAGNEQEEAIYLEAFRQGLRDLGYVEGKNIALENRFAAEQYDRFSSLAAELVGLKVDVLVAVTVPAALAAQGATTTIPVVFILVPDPIGIGLVKSLAHPGGNVTGLSQTAFDIAAKKLELFKEAIVDLSRVAFLVNPGNRAVAHRYVEVTQAGAGPLSVIVQPVEVRASDELKRAFSAITQDGVHGVVVMPDGMFFNERSRIAELSLEHRLPTMMFNKETVQAGGLMSYGPSTPALFRRAATYIEKILKGAKPSDLPVEQPTKFELIINLKTARALGLTVPPTLLVRADEVIE